MGQPTKGLISDVKTETGLVDGTYPEYIDMDDFVRVDMRIKQDGGTTGASEFAVYASWEPSSGKALSALEYDDIGLAFYESATFSDAIEKLIDNGDQLKGASALKVVFTFSSVTAADGSYSIEYTGLTVGAS